MPVGRLSARGIEAWLRELKVSGRSAAMRRKALATLRIILWWAVGRGAITSNPAISARMPAKERRPSIRMPAPSEIDAILAAIDSHRLATHMRIALMLGPRMGELNALRWDEDVDREAHAITINHSLVWLPGGYYLQDRVKTNAAQRTIYLPATLWDDLMAHEARQQEERAAVLARGGVWEDTGFVFTRSNGRPLRGDGTGGVGDQFKRCLRRAGVAPRNFHQLRHIAATMLLTLNGGNLFEVKQILGHSTYRISIDLYSHLAPELARLVGDRIGAYYDARLTTGTEAGVSTRVSD